MRRGLGRWQAAWRVVAVLLIAALAGPAGGGLGPAPARGQAREVRVGIPISLSGIFSRDAALMKEVYDLWAETVNAKGGLKLKGGSVPVRLIYYDDESSPVKSAQLVERLATADRVDLMLSGFGSSIVFAASAVAEKYRYPYISGAASANPIFERGFKYVFATLNKTFDEVEAAAKVFGAVQPKPKTAAIIGADHLFAKLSAEGYKKFMGEMGIDVVLFEIFPLQLTDYNSLILKVKRQNPDLLLVGGLFTHSLRVMKALKEVDFAPKGVAFSYGPTVPEFNRDLGKDGEGVIAASEWLPAFPYKDPLFGSAQGFTETFMKKHGREPDYVQAAGMAGTIAQQVAVETLGLAAPFGDKEREAIMAELHRQDIETLYGRVKFGPDGGIVQKPPIAVQNQGGKYVLVYPATIGGVQASRMVYPLVPWRSR
jgi:branched-chain amino acid transport system substrate-binding protein